MESPESDGLPPGHGRVTLTLLADVTHTNLLGNVHGGVEMRPVDSTAGAAAGCHSGGPAVTAAMDEMAFLAPVHVASAYLVFVAVDANGDAREVPSLRPETPEEERRLRDTGALALNADHGGR